MSVLMFKDTEEGVESCWFPPERRLALLAGGWRFTEDVEAEEPEIEEPEITLGKLRAAVKKLGYKGHARSDRETLEKIIAGQNHDNQD